MRVPGKKIAVLGSSLLAVVLIAFLVYRGARGPVSTPLAGPCRSLQMSAGASDISIDSARGVAYLAYLDRKPTPDGTRASGTIMLVDLNAAEPRVRAALASEPPAFRPIALSLYVSPRGERRLFVVDANGSVQIFEQSPAGAFALVKTVRDASLVNPTAIVAVGTDQFYVTTDAAWLDPATSGRLARWWRLAVPSSGSSVLYFDGQQVMPAASDLRMGAGIAASPDGRVIYVSEMSGRRLQLFERDPGSGALRPKKRIELPSLPNHLSRDAEGNVWIAAHARVVAALKSLEGTNARVPTQALRISSDERISEIYSNDGSALSGATAVAAHGRHVLIGSMSDPKLLLCQKD